MVDTNRKEWTLRPLCTVKEILHTVINYFVKLCV